MSTVKKTVIIYSNILPADIYVRNATRSGFKNEERDKGGGLTPLAQQEVCVSMCVFILV